MTPLCRQDDSLLLCIDIQERLYAAMPEPARKRLSDNTTILLKTADLLDIPVMCTEQYPQGLGKTLDTIRQRLPAGSPCFDKTRFSCCGADGLRDALRETHKRQVVITGLETHVCVMQTALELLADGYEVFVADDAVCSRRMAHWKSALNRLRQTGVTALPTESVLFEWLRDASHEHFKSVSRMLRDLN